MNESGGGLMKMSVSLSSPRRHKSHDPPRHPSGSKPLDPASPAGWTCRAPPPGGTEERTVADGLQTKQRSQHECSNYSQVFLSCFMSLTDTNISTPSHFCLSLTVGCSTFSSWLEGLVQFVDFSHETSVLVFPFRKISGTERRGKWSGWIKTGSGSWRFWFLLTSSTAESQQRTTRAGTSQDTCGVGGVTAAVQEPQLIGLLGHQDTRCPKFTFSETKTKMIVTP